MKNAIMVLLLFFIAIAVWLNSYDRGEKIKPFNASPHLHLQEWEVQQDGVCVPCETLMIGIIRLEAIVDSSFGQ